MVDCSGGVFGYKIEPDYRVSLADWKVMWKVSIAIEVSGGRLFRAVYHLI